MTPDELRYVQKLERRIHNQRAQLRWWHEGAGYGGWPAFTRLRRAYSAAFKEQRERLQEGRMK